MSSANGGSDAESNGATNGDTVKNVPLKRVHRQQHPKIRDTKAEPADVLVLAFGSHAFRYGSAVDSMPVKLPSVVAFPRKKNDAGRPPVRPVWARGEKDGPAAPEEFEKIKNEFVEQLDMNSRRIGGGKPIPWDVEVEVVSARTEDVADAAITSKVSENRVLVGRDADLLLRSEDAAAQYDIVAPMWDGKLVFGATAASNTLVRAALDELLRHVAHQLEHKTTNGSSLHATANGNGSIPDTNGFSKKNGQSSEEKCTLKKREKRSKYAYRHVAIVVPDASDRRDVAEIVDAIFRVDELRAAAVFVHQSSVSCALGAGLGTCAVVDIGHSATTVACVEEGSICGDSRVHLMYGAHQMLQVFEYLLQSSATFVEQIGSVLSEKNSAPYRYDMTKVAVRSCEQVCSFRTEENDRLLLAEVRAPSGDLLRVKVGLALRTLPAHGLVRPEFLLAANPMVIAKKRMAHERNNDDDNYLEQLYADIRRNANATAALPIGCFANEPDNPVDYEVLPSDASIVDAVIWSVSRAVKASNLVVQQPSRAPELHRRFLKSIVLSGGGASLDGIALALEGHIKKGLQQKGLAVTDVTVIDGGKGKGDEELAAATAILRDKKAMPAAQGDDTDTASLPWKGCAVMVEADAVKEYWVYKDDWLERNIRKLREVVPFYW